MEYRVTKQITPPAKPGTRASQVNRLFNAALKALLAQESGARYAGLYERYMGIAPRFAPQATDCDDWTDVDAKDAAVQAVLERGVLRLGYVAGAPYVYRDQGDLTGFDHDLAQALTGLVSLKYCDDARRMRTEWVEVEPGGTDQTDKLKALHQGLVDGRFDVALSGQMMLPDDFMKGVAVEWTAPTAMLFTGISYTGRDRTKLDVAKLEALRGGELSDFAAWAASESRRLSLELRIFSVYNPGPSPKSATDLVYDIHRRGGRAVWHTGDVPDSDAVMLEAVDHFAVGDSLASGAQSVMPGFDGLYLDVPANVELWPIAGFTAAKG